MKDIGNKALIKGEHVDPYEVNQCLIVSGNVVMFEQTMTITSFMGVFRCSYVSTSHVVSPYTSILFVN